MRTPIKRGLWDRRKHDSPSQKKNWWCGHFWGLVIIWRIVSKWRRPWRLREAFAERVFEKASRSLQGATTNPSRRFTNPSRRLHIPKVPRRRLGGFTRPPRRVRGWTACSYSIMTVTVFGQYHTVFRTVDSSTLFVVTVVLYYVYDIIVEVTGIFYCSTKYNEC